MLRTPRKTARLTKKGQVSDAKRRTRRLCCALVAICGLTSPSGNLINRTDITDEAQQIAHLRCSSCVRWPIAGPLRIDSQIGVHIPRDEADENYRHDTRANRSEALGSSFQLGFLQNVIPERSGLI